ncbi:bifunctional hydroxymethylpyrimidine kinase/phosphomethylpyrimidine kinase [Dongia soli]|uniref:hydroxymethylpyrimidine kinase n=1 Tax=Dongia soli TaxID=600628 RepID=A0ABU5E901_9PROT|nr:bifunctional hydroxymethylpyrimidine kinase/phosphomethylpyrimidine kinase [Dongia soli]MDY0882689.1 bifunctional hydroxymethylpyrimidine kinase/phosphomethylpyrimidine kinase [Dongia soli]
MMPEHMVPNILSIAGSDPSGGAGIQADLKTFSALRTYGAAAITALTAQNTRGVGAVLVVEPAFVARQIDMIFEDVRIDAVKIGMLANAQIISKVAACLRHCQPRWIVLDPVMIAKSGHRLLDEAALSALRRELLPMASIITPNLPEAAALLDRAVAKDWDDMEETAVGLQALGASRVLLKGGHLPGEASPDLVLTDGVITKLDAGRIATENTHGTGCTLSSAIAALLPQHRDVITAIREAKAYITGAIAASGQLAVGSGHGPVHHFHQLWHQSRP